MGFNNITTDDRGVKIKRQEQNYNGHSFATYSVMSYTKNGDDYIVGYIPCKFKKDIDLADKTRIKINNAFYVNRSNKGRVYTELFISEFDILEGDAPAPASDNSFMDIPDGVDGELPFK